MALPARRPEEAAPIGRDTEAARLAQMIGDAAAGAKRAALLLGVPGIGKTTLLRFAHQRAEEHGCITVSVRVPAAAGLPPRFPLGELLEGLIAGCERRDVPVPDRLRRVVAALTGTTSVGAYAVSLPQIADALEETGSSGTIAIFVDDYHWAPPEGTELMIAALRVVETPLCFLATARLRAPGEESATPLPEPTADLWIDHVEVRGLDPDAVAAVARHELGGDIMPSLGEALSARTMGNPLFIRETLQGWRAQGGLVQTGGFWGVTEATALIEARSLREMIAGRFARLPSDARAAAAALAVIGREATLEEIGAVTDLSDESLLRAVRALVAEGLVVGDIDRELRYRIAHPLYASSIDESMDAVQTSRLHGRICDELRRRAAAGHPTLASELAHHAVRALDQPADLRHVLRAAASEAENAGSLEEAAVWYGYLAEAADDPAELVRALTGQASAVIRSDPQRAAQLFTYALSLERNAEVRARLLLGRARANRVAGTFELALQDLEAALPLAGPDDAFDIKHAIGATYGMQSRIGDAEAVFAALAESTAGTSRHHKAVGHLGMVAYARGRLVEASALQEEALRTSDDPGYASYLRSNLCWMRILLGRWNEAEELLRETLREAVAAGSIHDETTASCVAARLAAWRGDLGRAFDEARRAVRLATRLGNPADLMNAHDALAGAFLENDMPGEAAAILADVLALDKPDVEPREFSLAYSVLASACIAAGDLARARTALARARHHLPQAPLWAIAVDRAEAELHFTVGDPLTALDLLRPWNERPSPIVFEQAHALQATAIALAALGDRSGAQARAGEALQIYQRLAARRRAERLEAWLAEHRVRRPGRPRSRLPGHLTQRETEILRLVVLGGSNREIGARLYISVATVKKHLENLMGKAGVSRRQELLPFAISIGALAVEELSAERMPGPSRGPTRHKIVSLAPFDRVRTD